MKQRELRVFVVDDDQSVRASLAALLESDGYIVESVLSAADYLAKAPHSGAACLVLDVRLPGLDGLALQRQLAERGRMEQNRAYHRTRRYSDGYPGNEAGRDRLSAKAV